MSYVNGKMPSLRKEIILAINLSFGMIFIIRSINTLLANINKIFLIVDMDYIFSRTFLVINLVLNLSLLLMLI